MLRDILVLTFVFLVFHVIHIKTYFLGKSFVSVNDISQKNDAYRNPSCPVSLTKVPGLNDTCRDNSDCKGRPDHVCCPYGSHRFCQKANFMKSTVTEATPKHRSFLGIPRYCPTTDPLQEFLPVQNCTKDADCGSRICCPDGPISYCRTAVLRLESRRSPAVRVIKNLVSYLQCSSPPPPNLDLFPKTCKYSFDCFPNICCQEKDRKVCRPAKRSILRFLTGESIAYGVKLAINQQGQILSQLRFYNLQFSKGMHMKALPYYRISIKSEKVCSLCQPKPAS